MSTKNINNFKKKERNYDGNNQNRINLNIYSSLSMMIDNDNQLKSSISIFFSTFISGQCIVLLFIDVIFFSILLLFLFHYIQIV